MVPIVVYCTGKRTSRKLVEKEVFCRHPKMLSKFCCVRLVAAMLMECEL